MKRILRRSAVVLSTLALLALATESFGQSLPTTNYAKTVFNGNGVGIQVTLAGDGNSSTTAGSFTTTVYKVNPNNENVKGDLLYEVKSYCVDLYNTIGSVEEVNISYQNGVVPNSFTGNLLDRNLGAAAYIMYEAELGTGAIQTAISISGLAANLVDAAVQIAIWEATFDGLTDSNTGQSVAGGAGLDTGDGAFYLRNVNTNVNSNQYKVVQLAKAILDAALDPSAQAATYFTRTGSYVNFAPPEITPPDNGGKRQDQITLVPEPANLAMALTAISFLGVGYRLRRKGSK